MKSHSKQIIIFILLLINTKSFSQTADVFYSYENKTISFPKFVCDTTGYLFQGVPTSMYGINLSTGTDTLLYSNLIPNPPNQQLNAFGFNRTDNYIWGYRLHTNELIRIAANYTVTHFAISGLPEKGFNVGDIDDDGIMYLTATSKTTVYRIDLNPNSATYLQLLSTLTIPASYIFDWAFSPLDGNIYAVDSSENAVYMFNKITGARTTVGIATGDGIDTVGRFGATYMDNLGNLFVSANPGGQIFKIAVPNSGNTSANLFSLGPSSDNNDGALCTGAFIASVTPESNASQHEVSVYPNPVIDQLTVKTNFHSTSYFLLYNILSQKIIETQFLNSMTLVTDLLSSGVYFYEVRNDNVLKSKGMIVKD